MLEAQQTFGLAIWRTASKSADGCGHRSVERTGAGHRYPNRAAGNFKSGSDTLHARPEDDGGCNTAPEVGVQPPRRRRRVSRRTEIRDGAPSDCGVAVGRRRTGPRTAHLVKLHDVWIKTVDVRIDDQQTGAGRIGRADMARDCPASRWTPPQGSRPSPTSPMN